MRNDVFEDIALLCQRVNKQVGEVFCSPETVMAKLIQSIFENKIQVKATQKHRCVHFAIHLLRVYLLYTTMFNAFWLFVS